MPPQRRKIVPPNTTSKARRKVAGAGRPAGSDDATGLRADTTTPAASDGVAHAPNEAARGVSAQSSAVDTTAPKPVVVDSGDTTVDSAHDETSDGSAAKNATVPLTKTPPKQSARPYLRPRAAGGEGDVSAENEAASAASEKSTSGIRSRHVILVAAIAVVSGVFAVVAAFKPFAAVDNLAWVDSAQTQQVTSAATDALQTLYTYKADTIDADFDAARAVLDPSMLEEFDSTAATTKSSVQQTNTGTDAVVTDIGVSVLQDDRAELIANVNISATQNGVASGSAEGPLTVNMEKIDGTWKLSAIDDQ